MHEQMLLLVPHIVCAQVINKKDQGAGKPSAMRKSGELPPGAGPEDSTENLGGRRHIKFNEADLEGLLNEEQGTGKEAELIMRAPAPCLG